MTSVETSLPELPGLRFDDARCLVTGGSRGLGRAIAEELARRGGRVAFTYPSRDDDAAETLASLEALASSASATSPGPRALRFKGSVTDPAHAREVTHALRDAWGGVDVLVCNAGLAQILPLALIEEEELDEVLAVNVKGAFHFARAAARSMIRARGGRVLFIGNFGSERVVEAPIHYAAAKSALRGMTESLARELGRYAIRVNLLAPGLLERGLAEMLPQHRLDEYLAQCPMGRLGTLEELAEVACFLVSDAASFVTGAKLAADGGV